MNEVITNKSWETKRLDTVSIINRGLSWSKSQENRYYNIGSVPVLRIGNVQERLELKDTLFINQVKPQELEKYKLTSDNIVMVGSNGNHHRIGDCCIIDKEMDFVYASFLIGIIPKKDLVEPKFLFYQLSSQDIKKKIFDSITGTTGLANLSLEFMRNVNLLLPHSIKEQRKIVSILENVDNNIDKTQEIIEKYEMMKQGLMHDLFTKGIDENGKPHTEFKDSELGEIPVDWNVKCLKDLIEIEHGYAFKGEYFTDEIRDYILLTPGNFNIKGDLYFNEVNTKYYSGDFPSKYILKNGDLLTVMTDLTKEMAILGNTIILESKFNILHNQRIGKVIIKDSKNIFDEYIRTIMNSKYCKDEIKKTATGTTVRHTAPERIYNALVPMCCYEEQKRISHIILSVEKLIQSEYKYLNKLQKIKTGLMQDLLTEKVRVKT